MAKGAAAPFLLSAIALTLPMIFFAQLTLQKPQAHEEENLITSTPSTAKTAAAAASKLGSACVDYIQPQDTGTTYFCVDQNGCCKFTTVQSAIDAVAENSQNKNIIWINNGVYYEKVVVPNYKPNITFQGQGSQSTAISWYDTAATAGGTIQSASVTIMAEDFTAKNISFKNSAMPLPGSADSQAVAINVEADRAAFWGCGFLSLQDTLLDNQGRHYYKDCYIEGTTDFIFGNATSFYENCEMRSVAAAGSGSVDGAVTAQARDGSDQTTGFAFVNCTISGTGLVWLGRAWRPYSRVVFAYTFMPDIISTDGWNDFGDPNRDQTVYFGEYQNTGDGANMDKRVAYAKNLGDAEAAPFLSVSFIDGDEWLQPF